MAVTMHTSTTMRTHRALSRSWASHTTAPRCCPLLLRHQHQHQHHQHIGVAAAASASPDSSSSGGSIEELFAAELANRQAAEKKQQEVAAASAFDGAALLALLRQKYGRSYDVSLVQRRYLGKVFVALNIMWKYQEQQSFGYSQEQYMQRLEYVAAALVSWGAVTTVQSQVAATKERPRVGKAVSIMLDVPPEQAREWIAV